MHGDSLILLEHMLLQVQLSQHYRAGITYRELCRKHGMLHAFGGSKFIQPSRISGGPFHPALSCQFLRWKATQEGLSIWKRQAECTRLRALQHSQHDKANVTKVTHVDNSALLYRTQAITKNIWWLTPSRFVRSICTLESNTRRLMASKNNKQSGPPLSWVSCLVRTSLRSSNLLENLHITTGEYWRVAIQEDQEHLCVYVVRAGAPVQRDHSSQSPQWRLGEGSAQYDDWVRGSYSEVNELD